MEHHAKTETSQNNYQVFYQGELVTQSEKVVLLTEYNKGEAFPTIVYFPSESIKTLALEEEELSTHCPIKGDASYWSFGDAKTAIWSYKDPMQEVIEVKGYYGFDQNRGFEIKTDQP